MARKALLIGTKTYQDGFKPLNSAPCDVEAIAALLRHPEIGEFQPDDVAILIDRESAELATKIETWYLSHTAEDLALLFIAGHGVKDDARKLHFAATNTRKVAERLITTTAVAASDLSNWMRRSRAKRQIAILNCCFSGAFGDLVPMDGGAIDVEEALGAEGRVVMTSTSSMDYAFERQNGELSVYGHYLVEGLTGAAAIRGSDEITVEALHKYISAKVKEEALSMVPQFFSGGSPHLRIAKVAIDVARLKEMAIDAECDGETEKAIRLWEKVNLLAEKGDDRQRAMNKIKQLSANQSRAETIPIAEPQRIEVNPKSTPPTPKPPKPIDAIPLESETKVDYRKLRDLQQNPIDAIPLESETKVDYRKLRDLLKAGKWEEADRKTLEVMIQAANRKSQGWLNDDSLKQFPCKDLRTIDQLWVSASNGHFGFSVQKKIWEECGSPMSTGKGWHRFCARVGWRGSAATAYVNYSDLKKNTLFSPISPKGELPVIGGVVGGWGHYSLFSCRDL
jgi:hypothetical protein